MKNDTVEESPHVIFNENSDKSVCHRNEDHEDFIENKIQHESDEDDTEEQARPQGEVSSQTDNNIIINVRELKSQPLKNIIRSLNEPTRTRSHFRIIEEMNSLALVSQLEPKNTKITLTDESWINVMHKELNQFERNKVWHLVPRPLNDSVIRTKWVYRNKINEQGQIVKNKARLVAKGYNQKF